MQNVQMHTLLEFLRSRQAEMTDLLEQMVNMESPTDHKPSLDLQSSFLASKLRELNASVEILEQPEAGNHVRASWGQGDGSVLILCHMDTVWPIGTTASRPAFVEGDMLFGPGSEDMKGGIVIALFAMRALTELNLLPADRRISLILNSDEETGSGTSRPIIEAEAKKHKAVFVLEPPVPPGAYKTQRKGGGGFTVKVTGLAAHAGADHAKGVNAIAELAQQILTIESFTDYQTGTTLNVGVVGGGTRSNVVPAEAWAEVDVRIERTEEGPKIEALMHSLKPHNPKTTLEVSGGISRPPLVRTPQVVALYEKAKRIADELDIPLSEGSTGGGSDGNFTAALDIPTLDGMGVVGDGGHAVGEYAVISSLPERAAILAAMLMEISEPG